MKRLGMTAWIKQFGYYFPVEGNIYTDKKGGLHRVLEFENYWQIVIID